MSSSLISHVSLLEPIQDEASEARERRAVSARRPARVQSPVGRRMRMREEQVQAAQARVAKETSRPKMLIDDSLPGKQRTPSSYVQEAKARYSRRTNSSLPTRRSSPFPPRTSSSFSRHPSDSYHPQLANPMPEVAENVIPDWIAQRDDFAGAYKRIKAARVSDLESICRKEASTRLESEKLGLLKWSRTQRLLCHLQPEKLDRMQSAVLTERTTELQSMLYVLSGCVRCRRPGDASEVEYSSGVWLSTDTQVFPDWELTPAPKCVLLRLRKTDCDQVDMNLIVREKRECVSFLSDCEYFSTLSPLKIQRLSRAVERCEVPKDEVVYHQGDNSSSLYIVRDGEVALQLAVKVGQGYRWPIGRHAWELSKLDMVYNLTLKTVTRGGFFGESELHPHHRRRTSAKALSPVIMYVISRERFFEVFTGREISDLRIYGNIVIPSPKSCELRVLSQFKAHKAHRQTLISASSVDCSCPDARDSILDKHTRKMMKWLKSLQNRSDSESREVKKGIIKVRKDRVIVRSVDMLGVAEHASEDTY